MFGKEEESSTFTQCRCGHSYNAIFYFKVMLQETYFYML